MDPLGTKMYLLKRYTAPVTAFVPFFLRVQDFFFLAKFSPDDLSPNRNGLRLKQVYLTTKNRLNMHFAL